jgi:hypothetical protein
MKRVAASFVAVALATAGVVVAQTTAPPVPPSDRSTQYPSSSSPSTSPSSSSSGNYSTTGKSHTQQMQDCMAAQQASHPSVSKSDVKKYCKSQVESSGKSSSSPHE